ncbi:transformer-2 protein homolog beta-like [Teleopsis dalmanni]|uniref:transformer-2 protein homolog beta-like n=1 Tax=Teleopsis dalmanni TaxID=139649 RepID=UPI0018CFB384|nr:transformer-2 protein homolog beta-like [Teleopsis dalmanni]XP_037934503.1 transformer-2 protein homolog beta-like [Teleopsis dalmanni]XP_037938544.1 transformer-2 protein homolog beta-like [Teleopsis dalmanni]
MEHQVKKERRNTSSDEESKHRYMNKKRRYHSSDEERESRYGRKRRRHYSSDEDKFRHSSYKRRRRSETSSSSSRSSSGTSRSRSLTKSRSRSYKSSSVSSSETSSVSSVTSSSSSRTDSSSGSRYRHTYYSRGNHSSGYHQSKMSRHQRIPDRYKPRPNKCLAIFGLNVNTASLKLRTYFERFGPVDKAEIAREAKTGVSKGYGFVYFAHLCDAKYAAEECEDDHIVDGKKLRLDYSITNQNQ